MSILNIRVRGRLRVYTVNDSSGQEECVFDDSNQITYGHLSTLVALISQTAIITAPEELAVDRMDIEAGTVAIAEASPSDTGPALPDTAIVKSHTFDRSTDVTFPGSVPGLVKYQATIAAGEADGATLRAAILYTGGDGMGGAPVVVARKVITPITKPVGYSIRLEWEIQYAIG